MSALILIPARGASKGIPRKNLRLLAGRPLLSYSIAAARAAQCRWNVIVTTEDEEIAAVARQLGADCLPRPAALSQDEVPLDPVVLDAAQRVSGPFDAVITVQPTSPFVTADHIDQAYGLLQQTGANAVFTVTDDTHLTWAMEDGQPVPMYTARKNRQQLPRRLKETGGVVCCRRDALLAHKTRFVPPFTVMELEPAAALDINDRFDWAFAEALLSTRRITIVTSGARQMARQLMVAAGLAKHAVTFVVSSEDEDGITLCRAQHYPIRILPMITADALVTDGGQVLILAVGEDGGTLARALHAAGRMVVLVGETDDTQAVLSQVTAMVEGGPRS